MPVPWLAVGNLVLGNLDKIIAVVRPGFTRKRIETLDTRPICSTSRSPSCRPPRPPIPTRFACWPRSSRMWWRRWSRPRAPRKPRVPLHVGSRCSRCCWPPRAWCSSASGGFLEQSPQFTWKPHETNRHWQVRSPARTLSRLRSGPHGRGASLRGDRACRRPASRGQGAHHPHPGRAEGEDHRDRATRWYRSGRHGDHRCAAQSCRRPPGSRRWCARGAPSC